VIDNATGVEGLRRVAERLRGRTLPRSVVYCAFAAEEIGLIGARHFVYEAQTRGQFERIKAIVNLDCIAHGERMEILASPDELRERGRSAVEGLGLDRRYELHYGKADPGVDAYPFAEENVPALSILYFPYDEYHLPAERPELVDEQRLTDAVDLAVALVEGLLEKPVSAGGGAPRAG
jgi:Zn-dependent M28 family amino/carboxypeptidase